MGISILSSSTTGRGREEFSWCSTYESTQFAGEVGLVGVSRHGRRLSQGCSVGDETMRALCPYDPSQRGVPVAEGDAHAPAQGALRP